jgi:hypothetical protein
MLQQAALCKIISWQERKKSDASRKTGRSTIAIEQAAPSPIIAHPIIRAAEQPSQLCPFHQGLGHSNQGGLTPPSQKHPTGNRNQSRTGPGE